MLPIVPALLSRLPLPLPVSSLTYSSLLLENEAWSQIKAVELQIDNWSPLILIKGDLCALDAAVSSRAPPPTFFTVLVPKPTE